MISENEYKEYVDFVTGLFQENCDVKGEEWLLHAAMGLVTESAEVMDLLKKHFFYNRELDKTKLKDELGDILFYWVGFVNRLGVSFEEIVDMNTAKLATRFPNGYTDKHANKRNEKAEQAAQQKVVEKEKQTN